MTEKMLFRRSVIVFCAILLVCGILIVRLYDLAMYDNISREVLSGQYTRKRVVVERQGFVYASDGKLLSHRENGAFAVVNPGNIADKNSAVQYLAAYSDYTPDDIIEKISNPVPFVMHLNSVPSENAPGGMYVCADYAENNNNICRHILGYRDSDGNGRDGIFRQFGSILDSLSGSVSYSYFADVKGMPFDAEDFRVENRCYTDTSGVVLTIDSAWQEETDRICDKHLDMGAVAVVSLATGDILSLSSRPVYDRDNVELCLDSDRGELVNRAFALYTPGSVFKTVVAAAALEKDFEYLGFEYECNGKCNVYGKNFNCHKASGHGKQTLEDAYANSCNTYFIQLANKVGFETICEMCEKMGLGKPYVIDGILVPAAKIPDKTKKYPPAYEANFSFGQGDTLMSVADVLNVFCICSTGVKRDFSLVKGIYDGVSDEMTYFSSGTVRRVLSDKTVTAMLSMMRACVTRGTGTLAGTGKVKCAGKTATAQSGQYKDGKELNHKWFAGVFPADEPRYAAVVLCDGNGEGNAPPAKIFAEISVLASGK